MKYNEYRKIVTYLKYASMLAGCKLITGIRTTQDIYTLDGIYKYIFMNLQKLCAISKKDDIMTLAKYYCPYIKW